MCFLHSWFDRRVIIQVNFLEPVFDAYLIQNGPHPCLKIFGWMARSRGERG